MKQHKGDSTGNCLQCCIAGIFDLELKDIPQPYEWEACPDGWFSAFYDWCLLEVGYAPIVVTDDTLDGIIHIECCTTIDGERHAVIAKGQTIVHNPAPSKVIITESMGEEAIVFFPLLDRTQQHYVGE